jgi:hypothetical protein
MPAPFTQQMSTPFHLNARDYPAGSWIVRPPGAAYAHALTEAEYEAWLVLEAFEAAERAKTTP